MLVDELPLYSEREAGVVSYTSSAHHPISFFILDYFDGQLAALWVLYNLPPAEAGCGWMCLPLPGNEIALH